MGSFCGVANYDNRHLRKSPFLSPLCRLRCRLRGRRHRCHRRRGRHHCNCQSLTGCRRRCSAVVNAAFAVDGVALLVYEDGDPSVTDAIIHPSEVTLAQSGACL